MLVITADQVNSRGTDDIVGTTLGNLNDRYGSALPLPVDRNAGDELQAIAPDGPVALSLVLELTRTGRWSVGLGVGAIGRPLPTATREASGTAFIAAREAVGAAKRSPTRFAVRNADATAGATPRGATLAADTEALLNLLLALRERRTAQGWQVFDLLEDGLTQKNAATRLGISPQAVGDRMSAAGVRMEREAHAPLARLLDDLASVGDATGDTMSSHTKGDAKG
jgi:hypothetical protein